MAYKKDCEKVSTNHTGLLRTKKENKYLKTGFASVLRNVVYTGLASLQ